MIVKGKNIGRGKQKWEVKKNPNRKTKIEVISKRFYWGESITLLHSRGVITIQFDDNYPNWGYICDLMIPEQYRKCGLGTELLLTAENIIKSKNLNKARLDVEKCDWLVDWYKRCGYQIIGIDEDYYTMTKEV